MKTPQTKQDLDNLIRDKIEENSELEYKDARALSDTKEIAKDVSAMANSAGGIVIYGISEENHFPKEITKINRNEFSKERLEQIITSNISPKIDQLKIIPIDVDGGVVYVVEIPQGTTAHQNTYKENCRYYKRRNFKVDPMLDYEIRDVMNRAKYPIVELEFEIEERSYFSAMSEWSSLSSRPSKKPVQCLKVRAYNRGNNYAQFVNYFIDLPRDIIDRAQSVKVVSDAFVEYYGENVVDSQGRFDPVLPGLYSRSNLILLSSDAVFDNREIKWRVHADNAPVRVGSISLNKIPFKKNAN